MLLLLLPPVSNSRTNIAPLCRLIETHECFSAISTTKYGTFGHETWKFWERCVDVSMWLRKMLCVVFFGLLYWITEIMCFMFSLCTCIFSYNYNGLFSFPLQKWRAGLQSAYWIYPGDLYIAYCYRMNKPLQHTVVKSSR